MGMDPHRCSSPFSWTDSTPSTSVVQAQTSTIQNTSTAGGHEQFAAAIEQGTDVLIFDSQVELQDVLREKDGASRGDFSGASSGERKHGRERDNRARKSASRRSESGKDKKKPMKRAKKAEMSLRETSAGSEDSDENLNVDKPSDSKPQKPGKSKDAGKRSRKSAVSDMSKSKERKSLLMSSNKNPKPKKKTRSKKRSASSVETNFKSDSTGVAVERSTADSSREQPSLLANTEEQGKAPNKGEKRRVRSTSPTDSKKLKTEKHASGLKTSNNFLADEAPEHESPFTGSSSKSNKSDGHQVQDEVSGEMITTSEPIPAEEIPLQGQHDLERDIVKKEHDGAKPEGVILKMTKNMSKVAAKRVQNFHDGSKRAVKKVKSVRYKVPTKSSRFNKTERNTGKFGHKRSTVRKMTKADKKLAKIKTKKSKSSRYKLAKHPKKISNVKKTGKKKILPKKKSLKNKRSKFQKRIY